MQVKSKVSWIVTFTRPTTSLKNPMKNFMGFFVAVNDYETTLNKVVASGKVFRINVFKLYIFFRHVG